MLGPFCGDTRGKLLSNSGRLSAVMMMIMMIEPLLGMMPSTRKKKSVYAIDKEKKVGPF